MPGAERSLDPHNPVVVTGLGAVTEFGWGVAPLWEGLRRGETAIGPITRSDARAHRTQLAAEVSTAGAPQTARRASWADRFALAAALEATSQAGLTRERRA